MKASPLVLLSLGVLAGASPVPDSDAHHGRSEQSLEARVQADINLAVAPNGAKTSKARRERGALSRRSRPNRRLRRYKQRQQRRDDDTDTDTNHESDGEYSSCDEWNDDDGHCVSKHQPPPESPPPAETQPAVPQNDHDTDCDTDWSDEGEYERCKAKGLVPTTHQEAQPTSPPPPPPHDDDYTSNPDEDTDCDTDWSDDGEHERCKAKGLATTAHPATPTSPPPTPPHDDDYTSNPDEDTDCDTDWSDDGEHERCKAKGLAPTTHQEAQPSQPPPPPQDDDYTSNPDSDTDCDSDWSDDGEHERCKAKLSATVKPVVTTHAAAPTPPPQNEHDTDCDTDWSDDGEHERCKAKGKTLTTTRFTQVAFTTRHVSPTTAAVLADDTSTDEDYYTDCDSDWSDDGEHERCRTKTISVTTTPSDSRVRPSEQPITVENGAGLSHGGVNNVVLLAGMVAAAAAFAL